MNTDEYRNFNKMWLNLINHINQHENLNEIFENNKELKLSNYKKYSTFDQIIQNSIKSFQLTNLKLKPDFCFKITENANLNSDLTYKGPSLIHILSKMLLEDDADFRHISIKDLPIWQIQLKQINELLWFNLKLTDNSNSVIANFDSSLFYVKKLLLEIKYVFEKLNKTKPEEINKDVYKDFLSLVSNLQSTAESSENINKNVNSGLSLHELNVLEQNTALMYSLMGCIQLHLITFTPLVDPIEKKRFKKQYIEEDLNCLKTLQHTYDIISAAMEYHHLGVEYRVEIDKKLDNLMKRRQKYSQKSLEKRPESNLYSNMIQDVSHYLNSNCRFNQLQSILSKFSSCFDLSSNKFELQQQISECIKIIHIWQLNSLQFLQQILKKYPSYQEDILQSFENAIFMTCYGFNNLKKLLVQNKNSLSFEIENTNLKKQDLNEIMENIIEYPNLELFPKNVESQLMDIVKRLDCENYEKLHMKILKLKFFEIQNSAITSSEMSINLFEQFNNTLNLINKIWKNQEEIKKKQEMEDESMFVVKTRCTDENEEEEDLNLINELFPTTVNEDFSDFLEINSLNDDSNKLKIQTNKTTTKYDFINETEFQYVAENFITLMEAYSKTHYFTSNTHLQVNPPSPCNFNDKLKIFQQIFEAYKSSLNEVFDMKISNTFRLIINYHQDQLSDLNQKTNENKVVHNIYKNANIPEIRSCVPLLEKIQKRTNEQLELYPEHATLIDLLKITSKISNFSTISPIIRFNTGFQLLRQKLAQWNEVAHKNNHMRDLEIHTAEFVQRWTKMELQYWRNCLLESQEKIENSTYKYWFFIFNLINEFMENITINIQTLEKDMESKNEITLQSNLDNILKILQQFIESSNYGDFLKRLKLLKSFELYISFLIRSSNKSNPEKEKLVATIYSIRIYYEQFSNGVDEFKKNLLSTVEKKLKELVKIESFNKDLSYFSMKNNIARVHRNLNKFIKEYEKGLKESITNVFEYKEGNLYDLSSMNDKGGKNLRYDPKVKYYMVDVKNFIAFNKFKESKNISNNDTNSNLELNISSTITSCRLEKFFAISKNICKEIITKSEYPILTSNLEGLLLNYFETYEHLHNLNVDRNLDKAKQIAQNKNFIQQKRKALADTFKTLTKLGINYRTGLMEISVNPELVNLIIEPFSIDNLLLNINKTKTLNQNFTYLNENLNLYYTKCTFKMKTLQKILTNPNAELGSINIDRIKGFSIDMFLFVQNQRKLLSSSVNLTYEFQRNILNLNKLINCCQNNNFDETKLNFIQLENQLLLLKDVFNKINTFITQFKLLLDGIPSECNNENYIFENSNKVILKNSNKYDTILNKCEQIAEISKESLTKLKKLSTLEPLDYRTIQNLIDNKDKSIKLIIDLQSQFNPIDDYLPLVTSLSKLIKYITEVSNNYEDFEGSNNEIDFDTICIEIENILNTSLIAIQNLFKKYNVDDKNNKEKDKKINIIGDSEIYDNHLKIKIFKEMANDFILLNMEKVCLKIQNIYVVIKHLKHKTDIIKKIFRVMPILHQYNLLSFYYIFQQLGAHKVTVKILYVMLSAFIELGSKGFCSPPDLIQDDDGQQQQQNSKNEGGGFSEDNTTGNEKDVSDKIENEDQLDDAKRPEDRNNKEENNQDCKEEKGIDMSDNFDANLQDLEKNDNEEDDKSDKDDDENEIEKEMGDTEKDADKLDEQIWGSDNEEHNNSEDENEMSDDETGKGNKEESDAHNDLDSKKDSSKKDDENRENSDDLNAVDNEEENINEKKQKEKDIDNMKESEYDEEQINPHHNNLEEPPEAEDMQLDENFGLEGDDDKEKDKTNDMEDPFDIDKMKENMNLEEQSEEKNEDGEENNDENNISDNDDDSEGDDYDNLKRDQDHAADENKNNEMEENEESTDENKNETENLPKETENEETEEQNPDEDKKNDEIFEQSKDKSSKEENVQPNQTDEIKGSNDQVQNSEDKTTQPEQNLDDQETGEEGKGTGQANDESSEKGHQSTFDTKEIDSTENNLEKKDIKIKSKPQKANENRALGEQKENTLKNLKTIDKNTSNTENKEESEEREIEKPSNSEEYQHIKNPEKNEITAFDDATEEQSKQIQNEENKSLSHDEEEESVNTYLNEDGVNDEEIMEDEDTKIKSENNKQKTDQQSKSKNFNEEQNMITEEKMEVEGENVDTHLLLRGTDTTAHCLKENLNLSLIHEPSDLENLEMKKMYLHQLGNAGKKILQTKEYEIWQTISSLMQPSARELCEQLRLILEPTKCAKLKGDYKTGRRINMKKIIPYIASQFRKDKIWLRRTKPSQRDYKITIAIDDSKSMHHNNSKEITLKTISLVSQALTLLESGKLNILSFGESPQIILNHNDMFNGYKLINSLNFEQNQSKIAELLDFVRIINIEDNSSGTTNRLFENLLLILSDGRNIFSEGEQKVKNSVKLAKLSRIFIVYIIVDNPENKHSILDIRVPNFSLDKKSITMKSYLDTFPFPYYVIVRDLNQLPLVLSEAMRQWFELVNSEQ